MPTPHRRVLIVRLSAMGDILHALPAVSALRAAQPQLEIGWLVEERWLPLLRSRPNAAPLSHLPRSNAQPLVDFIHCSNLALWRRSWLSSATRSGLAQLIRELRAQHYDAVIDFQGALRSGFLARLTCAHDIDIYGEDSPREWIARYLFSHRVRTTGSHVIEQDLELASAFAATPLPYTPPLLPHDDEARQWSRKQMHERPLVLMNPGAGWGAKCWPAERYGRVAQALFAMGLTVLVNAGPAERGLANQVATESAGAARVVEPTLQQLIELTRLSALFIGGDTGPLHLAAALEVPTVAIFGPTDPARNGPFANRAVILRSHRSQRNHARKSAPEAGLLTITPAEVLAAARNLLGHTL
ncbi:MAG: glycosyltransferase family 9 protein [Acidobacteriaceae bacterium]